MPDPSDRDLALRARRGDAEAFGELVRRYQTSVFNVCYRLLGERREAEDLAQEAFIRAYERLDTFDADLPFGPWMRRVAANLCLNWMERAPQCRRNRPRPGPDLHGAPLLVVPHHHPARVARQAPRRFL